MTGTKNNLTLPILDERRICPISTKWGCYFLDSTVIYHSFKGIWKRYRGQFQTNAQWAVPEIDSPKATYFVSGQPQDKLSLTQSNAWVTDQ